MVALLCSFGAPQARAQPLVSGPGDIPVSITSDAVEFDQDLDVFTAKGNVRIEQGGTVLTADWVALNNSTRHGLASGNVLIIDEGDEVHADFLQFNLETGQGVMYEGELVTVTGFTVKGSELRRTSEDTYEFENPTFTTCQCPEEGRKPWRLRAKSGTLEVGGYAVTKNTTVDVLGVPVLWTPRAMFPVKSERQSGLLFPTFSNTSRRGMEIGVPFFWAAHPQVGVTVTPRWTADRGINVRSELEYLIGDESRKDFGTLAATVVPDDSEVTPDTNATPYDSLRWGIRWRHQQYEGLPWGIQAKAFINMISDNDFPFDYELLDQFRRNRFLESNVSLTKNFGRYSPFGSYIAVRWADDLQGPDDQDRDEFLLQRLPEVSFAQAASFLPDALPFMDRLLTSFDIDYTHYWYKNDPLGELPNSINVDNIFLDTGIEALPDGLERDPQGNVVTLDGEIINNDGTTITAAELLAAAIAADPEADPEEILMEIMPLFDPDQSGDNFPPGPEGDGLWQEGEPVRDRGHKLLVNPRLGVPFRIGDAVDVLPELGYHGTFYQSKYQGFNQRSLITGRLDVRSRLRKVIDVPWIGGVDHLVEPQLTYFGIANVSGDDDSNPLFMAQPAVTQERIRQLALNNVIRDPADRIPDTHGFLVGVSNRFYSIEPEPGTEEEEAVDGELTEDALAYAEEDEWVANRLLADITTSFEYRTSDMSPGWFVTEGIVYPTQLTQLDFSFGWDMDAMNLAETRLGFRWSSLGGHSLGFNYRFVRDIPRFFEDFRNNSERYEEFEGGFSQINQVGFNTRISLTPSWYVIFAFRYSFEQAIVLTNRAGIEYISKCRCWAVQVSGSNDRDRGFDFQFRYTLLGIGDDRGSPF
jgi:lipopolysaccharide export system protein LptA